MNCQYIVPSLCKSMMLAFPWALPTANSRVTQFSLYTGDHYGLVSEVLLFPSTQHMRDILVSVTQPCVHQFIFSWPTHARTSEDKVTSIDQVEVCLGHIGEFC